MNQSSCESAERGRRRAFARTWKLLGLGVLTLAIGMATAWAIGRQDPAAVEPAPMEQLLVTAESATPDVVTWDLPVTRNESVEKWIDFLKGRNKARTRVWLERSGRYAPLIKAKLRERGMPEDLIYLAFIESGFSPKAYSRAAASGIWQFIAETGRRYGLEVSSYVDERRDPIAATDAALEYLSELYDRFGSWYLAAAAYNTGENRVARIMRQVTGRERGTDSDFWKIASRLPRETRNYVPLMLAAGHIAKEPEKYGFDGIEYQDPLAYDTVRVPGAVSLSAVARAAGTDRETVMDLNPHLIRGRTPPDRAYPIRIPAGTATKFAVAFPSIHQAEAARASVASATRHRVRRGETLTHIAKRYDVSVRDIQRWNGMGRRTLIRAGQTLRIGD